MNITYLKSSFFLLIFSLVLFSCNVAVEPDKKQELRVSVTTVGESSVQLSWNALEGVEEYVIMLSTTANGKYFPVGGSKSTTGSVKILLPSRHYFFKVAELKGASNSEMGIDLGITSNIVDATTKAGTLQTPVINSQSVTEYSTTFSWDQVTAADSYLVYRLGSEYSPISHYPTYDGETTFTDWRELEGGVNYRYRVAAYNSTTKQISEQSVEVVLRTKNSSLPTPLLTYNLSSYDVGWNLNFAAGQSLSRYQYRSSTGTFNFNSSGGITDITSLNRSDVQPGKTYYYRFKLFNETEGKASPLSQLYTITIPQPELTVVPRNVKLDNIVYNPVTGDYKFHTDITISWEPVAEAEIYYIYEFKDYGSIMQLGSTTNTAFKHNFSGSTSKQEYIADIRVRAVKTSTREAGPFSAPLMVKIK